MSAGASRHWLSRPASSRLDRSRSRWSSSSARFPTRRRTRLAPERLVTDLALRMVLGPLSVVTMSVMARSPGPVRRRDLAELRGADPGGRPSHPPPAVGGAVASRVRRRRPPLPMRQSPLRRRHHRRACDRACRTRRARPSLRAREVRASTRSTADRALVRRSVVADSTRTAHGPRPPTVGGAACGPAERGKSSGSSARRSPASLSAPLAPLVTRVFAPMNMVQSGGASVGGAATSCGQAAPSPVSASGA